MECKRTYEDMIMLAVHGVFNPVRSEEEDAEQAAIFRGMQSGYIQAISTMFGVGTLEVKADINAAIKATYEK